MSSVAFNFSTSTADDLMDAVVNAHCDVDYPVILMTKDSYWRVAKYRDASGRYMLYWEVAGDFSVYGIPVRLVDTVPGGGEMCDAAVISDPAGVGGICKYCGSRNNRSNSSCTQCGAPL